MKKSILNLALVVAATAFAIGCGKDEPKVVCSTCTLTQSGITTTNTVCDNGYTVSVPGATSPQQPLPSGQTRATYVASLTSAGFTCK
jgi:hypothetical protein